MNTSTSDQMHNAQRTFAAGEPVLLHSIHSRPELNGTIAEVIDYADKTSRYSVLLPSGEKIRVKQKSVMAVPDAPAGGAGDATAAADPGPKDPTIFIANGQFLQPLAPAAPNAPAASVATADEAPERLAEQNEHRLRLPAGHWEVRLVEQHEGALSVTLVATEVSGAAEPRAAAWNELRGLRVTRSLLVDPLHEDVMSADLAAAVEGSMLVVRVPRPTAPADATGTTVDDEIMAEAMQIDEPRKEMREEDKGYEAKGWRACGGEREAAREAEYAERLGEYYAEMA